jgi:hypothetical protein
MPHAATGWGLRAAPKLVVSSEQVLPSASCTVTLTPSMTETVLSGEGTAVTEMYALDVASRSRR